MYTDNVGELIIGHNHSAVITVSNTPRPHNWYITTAVLTHSEFKCGLYEVWQISMSAFAISLHRWYARRDFTSNAIQCVSGCMLAYLYPYNKGENHKIDIYRQTISAVYTTKGKRENSTQQRKRDSSSRITHGRLI